ncbi:protein jagged-1 isoform X3 [Hydra vulgaris]|uniref:Protein jagged-1 isoform X3 n=1 Tax=Hydra vulgaris TaxID=6087 RepID=A0ABM4CHJ1_HYDVU
MAKIVYLCWVVVALSQFQNTKSIGNVEIQIEYFKFQKDYLNCAEACVQYTSVCLSNINYNTNCDIGYIEQEYKQHSFNLSFINFTLPLVVPVKDLYMISIEVKQQISNNSALLKKYSTYISFTPHNKWIAVRQQFIGFYIRTTCDLPKSANATFWCDNPGHYYGYDANNVKLCHKGWEGKNCDKNYTICIPRDNYRCRNNQKICNPGWTGINCEISTYKKLCKPRDDHTGHYGCSFEGEKVCNVGWEGENCLKNIDDCLSNPCLNNGSCIDLHANFECVCPGEYGGKQCEIDFRNEPCRNNGIMLLDNTCKCRFGYKGNKCEVCIPYHLCVDHGTCKNHDTCNGLCIPGGWVGQFCEIEQDGCSHNRGKKFCSSKGICVNDQKVSVSGQAWKCLCYEGWVGKHCEIKIHICNKRSPCQNGGTCLKSGKHFNDDQIYNCRCPLGFSGKNCETEINVCEKLSPCQNGGTCLNIGKHFNDNLIYECQCPIGFSGKNCDNDLHVCNHRSPCQNGGTCLKSGKHFNDQIYDCICPLGFSGKNCEIASIQYKQCMYREMWYIHNDTWDDACNVCRCDDGVAKCTDAWCGQPKCYQIEDPNCKCKFVEGHCITPPCLPWGMCNFQTIPVLYMGCFTEFNAELAENCAKVIFFFNVRMLPKGILLEELCQQFHIYKKVQSLFISDEVSLQCSHARFNSSLDQLIVNIYSKKKAVQLSLEIAKYKHTLVEQFENFKWHAPPTLVLFFRSVVYTSIERPSTMHSFLKEERHFFSLFVCMVVCVLVLFVWLSLWLYKKMTVKKVYLSDTTTIIEHNKLKENTLLVKKENLKKGIFKTISRKSELL